MDNSKDQILAKEYTLEEILRKKYTVDYFQREYLWQKSHIDQLVTDLVGTFMNNYKDGDSTEDVAYYSQYYMGTIVLNERGSYASIIDGQQRITSLTLLLIYLHHATNQSMATQLSNLIYSDSYGKMSFNINVPEREDCLRSLYETGDYTVKPTDNESVRNMVARYKDIKENFPSDVIKDNILTSFVYWVKGKLVLARIQAPTEEIAYTIFETMNDRGLSLTSSDMLRGFILSKFSNDDKRNKVNTKWKQQMVELGDKDTETQFFQSWLRSQFAETIRPTKQGAINMDFENIGTKFHSWFKDNYDKGLLKEAINGNIEHFIEENYNFYLRVFMRIKNAERFFDSALPHIYYLQCWCIAPSLSYPLYLAPLTTKDTEDEYLQKIEIVAKYIDGFVVRRSVNFRLFSQSSIRYTMCNLVKSIRNKTVDELRQILADNMSVIDDELNFTKAMPVFRLHGMNGSFVKYFLCRLTAFVDEGCGLMGTFKQYMYNPGGKPYEIEHIWSDHYEWHTDESGQAEEFKEWRNRIGDLVLLPNGTNQSYGDMKSEDKIPLYVGQNSLASSLTEKTYDHNPNFTNFVSKHNLSFKSYTEFKQETIKERCKLYAELANIIWNKDLA